MLIVLKNSWQTWWNISKSKLNKITNGIIFINANKIQKYIIYSSFKTF